MAKPIENKIVPTPAAIEAVYSGATVEAPLSESELANRELESNIAKFLTQGDVGKMLDKVTTAKVEEFAAPERDFWKPKDPGQPKELRGIYLGSAKSGRLEQHAVATKDSKGKPIAMRFNGAHGLTRAMKQLVPGTMVLIEYLGETGTMSGNKFGHWRVCPLIAK